MARSTFLSRSLTLVFASCIALGTAKADPVTLTGSLAADNSTFNYNFSTSSTQTFNFYTTSYGGGMNANGTLSAGGGFDPVLTLFSSSGMPLGFGGGDGMCHGASVASMATGLCEDASFSETLAPGSYSLYLSEFPNVALGSLSDGFLAGSDANFTGTNCGDPTGMFLESDVSPCVQRTSSYAVNVTTGSLSAVPEPAPWLLVGPAAAAFLLFTTRRQFA